jgi:hypothetical protein
MGTTSNRAWLDWTWLATLAGLLVILRAPSDLEAAAAMPRNLLRPSTVCMDALGWTDTALIPVVAALQLVLLGLALDALLGLIRRRSEPRKGLGLSGPLAAWKVLLMLAFVSSVAVSLDLRHEERMAAGDRNVATGVIERRPLIQDRLTTLVDKPDEKPRIVWIGDSLGLAALLPEAELEDMLARVSEPADFELFAIAGADLTEYAKHLDALLDTNPERILLQVNLLFLKHVPTIERRGTSRVQRWAKKRDLVTDKLEGLGITTAPIAPGSIDDVLTQQSDRDGAERLRAMDRWRLREARLDDPSLLLAHDFLDRVRARGIRCDLVQVPVSKAIPDATPTFFADRSKLARELADMYGMSLWAESPTWPTERFHDAVHLKPAGSRHFTELLVRFLSQ